MIESGYTDNKETLKKGTISVIYHGMLGILQNPVLKLDSKPILLALYPQYQIGR